MIKQLSNSVIAKYCDLSMSRRSIICLSLRLRQIIDLLATNKSQYFAQPRPIIVKYYSFKLFPRFGLVETTRIIHHNQLLFTKCGELFCHFFLHFYLKKKISSSCSCLNFKGHNISLPRRAPLLSFQYSV